MNLTKVDAATIAEYAGDLAESYKIRLAADLEDFSRAFHEVLETAMLDYVEDCKRLEGFEDLKNYEVQYGWES